MTNDMIAARMEELGVIKNYDQIFADAAEPKSIEEIYRYGYNIQGAPKGPGSVKQRIQLRNQYEMVWTEGSVECIKEQRNCRYIPDKNGKITDKITHQWSHGMDACDYGVVGYLTPGEVETELIYDDPVAISPV
jgi:phage terminase large subunit